ncbi:hypothetical protein PGB34_09295 [Xenophilus arseniciresistens]|uniref:Energy transducer TonB n=1 Tax=Xenophilus arseniciresistens TaxID=1283306 RepID=A0AAE3N8I9_9BURK|nr:hypothetical protein [Xenophilus arseniciresistens]MDA7416563.1 hypothetical protein [Xenophilus arseniciresistens]
MAAPTFGLHDNQRAGADMRKARRLASLLCAVSLSLAGCSLLPKADDAASTPDGTPAQADGKPGDGAAPHDVPTVRLITAQTPTVRAWRKQGAQHIYKRYASKIYKGKIPPLVYAVVVVETDLDAAGRVVQVSFSRTPGHAPEVPPQIAEMIKAASPFPAPGRLGAHTYVDTWLWDKSGKFQLDTLTQGQRSR